MLAIPLERVANQSFSVTLDGAAYDFVIKEASGCMCADIARDGVQLVTGARIVAGTPLLALRYLQHGDFIFVGEDLPMWQDFVAMYYASPGEL